MYIVHPPLAFFTFLKLYLQSVAPASKSGHIYVHVCQRRSEEFDLGGYVN